MSAPAATFSRLAAFFALCAFATVHWVALIDPAPIGRGFAVAMLATACGGLLALSGRLSGDLPGPAIAVPRVVLVIVAAGLGIAVIGIRAKLLLPAGWNTLSDRLSGGISVVGSVSEWPYSGPNVWLRLTTLAAAPLVATLAAALAFWPAKDTRAPRPSASLGGLALLIVLYAVALAARPFGQEMLRGVALLLAIAAWLWLPRLRTRDLAKAGVAVAVAGLAALGLTTQVASTEPWVDYKHWSWTLHKERTAVFDWRHSYGPIHWPRKGKTVLLVKSREPHYWRAESLDRFDGFRWGSLSSGDQSPRPQDVVAPRTKGWTETVQVTVRGIRSQLLFAPGTPYGDPLAGPRAIVLANGAYVLDGQLKPGDTYTIRGYVPDPSVKQMRSAPLPDRSLALFTRLHVPDQQGLTASSVDVPLRGVPGSGDPQAAAYIERSRYRRIYRLAQHVTRGAATPYDMVKRIGAYLEGDYTYSEHPARHRFPLEAFLFDEKSGYCQQFSGAAALMLRMLGVPTRVASGFAPGTRDKQTKEFVVRDLDAHSWIEVWFQGIGWVPFDPTPALAPAASQSVALAAASAARGDTGDRVLKKDLNRILGTPEVSKGAKGGGLIDEGGTPWGAIALGIAAFLLAVTATVALIRRRRRRIALAPALCGDPDVDQLVKLLSRLGLDVEGSTTLLALEGRLQRLAGPEAAGYARRLRERRFGSNGHAAPSRAERRRLRQTMVEAVEAGPWTRLQVVLPDDPRSALRSLKLVRRQRTR